MQYIRPLYWMLFVFILTPIGTYAQFSKNWSSWKELHKDQDITVELMIYTPKPNSCIDRNKKFKFKYRVTGKYKKTDTYLNWKISYVDCNGLRYFQQNSLPLWKKTFEDISGGITIPASDKQFTGERIDKLIYDKHVSQNKKENSGLLPSLVSEAPKRIKGLSKIFIGETIELEVEGGVLGKGANWIWYIEDCGRRKVGEGKKVTLNIPRKATVFVRAEGPNNKTKCIEKFVDVDLGSSKPNSISGKANICNGETAILSVNGGTLGVNAQWIWYEDVCGTKRIGTGPTITVQPKKTRQYYVRAEGKFNNTNCVSILVNVNFPVKTPKKIYVDGSSSICQGESLTLSVKESYNSSIYKWYSESCGGKLIGTGASITIKPNQTTIYFVRAEGVCNETICLSKYIVVFNSSTLPSLITETISKRKKTLQISKDARLASDAKWKWYKKGCGVGHSVGNGASIRIKDRRKPNTYFVRAEGNCPSANCTQVTIYPVKNFKKKFQHFNTIHFGIAFGFEYNIIEDINKYTSYNIDRLEGMGLRGEAYFFPLKKDFFSLGVLSSISIGTSLYLFKGGDVPNTDPVQTDKYNYIHGNIGAEMAMGFPFIKMLTRVNQEVQHNKLDRKIGNSTIAFNNELNRDHIGVGLRFGSYKGSRNLDILYLLYRNNQNRFLDLENTLSGLENRLTGFQISWKRHNRLSLKTNIYLPITSQQINSFNSDRDGVSFYSSLLINLDYFY